MSSDNTNELHIILGAGAVGMALMDALVECGKKVRIVNRSGVKALPKGVENLRGDVASLDFARKTAEGATHVYDALGAPYDRWAELFPALQKGAIEAAATAGAKLIVLENLYMYGNTHGKPMTEDMPNSATTVKGIVRAQMSEELLAAHRSGKIRVAIIRASDFIGPRAVEGGLGGRVIYPALEGKAASVIGNPDMLHTYSYVPDVANAMVTLGGADSALGQIWHVPNAETITTRQYIELIFANIGKPVKISAAPKPILWLMGLFNPTINAVYEMTYQFEEPFILDSSKFVRTFDNSATPIKAVIAETVAWYRANPKHK
ncbi:MAG: NAD-dependent epimerase/dehydratase family protein [Anaerolineae bacterium]|nr:NAD-dependent epimerase/dehydratase family protein [Anaerolineae bacterium]